MRRVLFLLCLLMPVSASAQTPTGYVMQYFNAGATAPLTQSDTIAASAVTCGVTPKLTGPALNTVNPTKAFWDDPANPTTADCSLTFSSTASLFALPIGGSYEGVLIAVSAGGNSPPSGRAPFSLAPLPPVRTGLRLTR